MCRIRWASIALGLSVLGLYVLREENDVSAVSSTLPAPIEAIIAGYTDQCRQLGGVLTAGADRLQIMTGDGKPD